MVGIDLVGPLPTTAAGNKYIVALTDYFTKFPMAAAIPEKSAKCVSQFIYHCITLFGCMETIISDQGREFVNQVIDDLTNKMGIQHRISSPYHPQTNGLRERDNRTLKTCLSKLVNEKCNDWDEHLQGALFSYRTAPHSSTKISPYEAVFGKKARMPIDPTIHAEVGNSVFL